MIVKQEKTLNTVLHNKATGQICPLDSAIVKTQNLFLPNLFNVSSPEKQSTVMKRRKWPSTHRQPDLKQTPSIVGCPFKQKRLIFTFDGKIK